MAISWKSHWLVLFYTLFSLYLNPCMSITWNNGNGYLTKCNEASLYATINDTVYIICSAVRAKIIMTPTTESSTLLSVRTPENISSSGQCATAVTDTEILNIGAMSLNTGIVYKFDAIQSAFVSHTIPPDPNQAWSPCIACNYDDKLLI